MNMGAAVAAVVYIWLAQGAAFLLTPRAIPFALRARAFGFWAITAPLVFVLQNPLTTLFVVAALMLVVAPLAARDRAAFFLVAVPTVPIFISAPLPFPGINYLTELTHLKLAALVILIPVFFSGGGNNRQGTSGPSIVLIVYVLYTSLLVALSGSITGGLRFFLDQLLIIALPYFAIRYALRKTDDMDAFFQAFLIASLILAIVAIVSRAKGWDIYASAASVIRDLRQGGLRVNATAGTHALAFHLAAAFLILEFLKQRIRIGFIALNAMRALFVAGMLTTGSRGALGALAVAWCIYKFLTLRSAPLRMGLFCLLSVAAIGGSIWLAQGDVGSYDEHGTFSYRQELLWTSFSYIAKYPFFGDRHFLLSGEFDHLLQGQGIIDVTNLYLQVALTFGLTGLALFSCVFMYPALAAGRSVLQVRRSQSSPTIAGKRDDAIDDWSSATAVTVAIVAGWLFLIATTSDVGLTLHLGVAFAALCQGLRRLRPIVEREGSGYKSVAPSPNALATA
jgi:hypothetical protein